MFFTMIFVICQSNPFLGMRVRKISCYFSPQNESKLSFVEIRLKFKGVADVHWTETETTGTGSNQRTETVSYTAHESYFEQRVPVYGKGKLKVYFGYNNI